MKEQVLIGRVYKSNDRSRFTKPFCIHGVYVFYEYASGIDKLSPQYTDVWNSTSFLENYKLCEEPVKWYQVVTKKPNRNPFAYSELTTSKEAFLGNFNLKEEDFEFIKLVEVKL